MGLDPATERLRLHAGFRDADGHWQICGRVRCKRRTRGEPSSHKHIVYDSHCRRSHRFCGDCRDGLERASAFSPDAGDARTSSAHVAARGWLVYRCYATLRRLSFYFHRFAAICFSHHRRHRQSSRNRCRIDRSSPHAWRPGAIGPCICGVQSGNGGNAVLWLAKAGKGARGFFIPRLPPPIRDPTGKVRERDVHLDSRDVLCQRSGYRDRRPLPVQRYWLLRRLPTPLPISC